MIFVGLSLGFGDDKSFLKVGVLSDLGDGEVSDCFDVDVSYSEDGDYFNGLYVYCEIFLIVEERKVEKRFFFKIDFIILFLIVFIYFFVVLVSCLVIFLFFVFFKVNVVVRIEVMLVMWLWLV